ncbi:MAG: hypothetical protein KA717_19850 [Woronichinia naegeliana WA131]|uniref:Uncharacterized protein n=1 Tax=Woronichinia naegeliana WA131 TaxID=2824559 RepID=A0A977L4T3_9CYAN|nr:MAG: hypothetical protein KA717_05145 [Woronichinia naegeliana WA131]UXE64505.1 MAG: hypothetical protein KA717_19850 [Woronichinia naegeliana WA131]
MFSDIYQLLKTRGILTRYEVLDKQLLIPLDGTEYFSSQNIHCEQCSHRTHKNGTVTYFHWVRPLVDKSCCNQGSTGNPY